MANNNRPWVDKVTLENARVKWKNFSGNPTDINPAGGRRNIGIYLPDEAAIDMKNKGWNVKIEKKNEETDPDVYYIEARINFKTDDNSSSMDPKVFMVTGRKINRLTQSMVHELDENRITSIDVTLNPSFWDMRGKSGITAYVDELYATIERSVLGNKYAELEEDGMLAPDNYPF